MWTLNSNIKNWLLLLKNSAHLGRLKVVLHFSHTLVNNWGRKEDKQVSQSIFQSPSALSVQHPGLSGALKISLISFQMTVDI